jgi:glycosyltransferase 2 family protein
MKEILKGMSGRSAFLIRLFGTLLALALLIYLLRQQGWHEIESAFRKIPFWRLALAMGLMIISRLAVSGRWYVLLRSGGVNVTPGQALRVTFAGLFATNFLPTTVGGDVIRLAGALQLRFDAAVSAASLIADRVIGMAGMALLLPFGLPSFLLSRQAAGGWLPGDLGRMAGYAVPIGKLWQNAWEKGMRLVRKVLAALSLWLKQPRALLGAMVFTWIHMLCLFSILRILFTGMDQSISFWLVGGLYSLVYFVTLMPFSINGYGIQEVSMTLIFSTVGGASMESGITAALLFRTIMMLASLPGALFVPDLLAGVKAQAGVSK